MVKKVQNESNFHALYIFIVVFWYMPFFYTTHLNTNKIKRHFSVTFNISVNGNHNILMFAFTLNVFYLTTKVVFCYILLVFPISFVKSHSINFVTAIAGNCFKLRRHKL